MRIKFSGWTSEEFKFVAFLFLRLIFFIFLLLIGFHNSMHAFFLLIVGLLDFFVNVILCPMMYLNVQF